MTKKILIPVDFSETSWAAVRFTLSMAEEVESELVLLHTYPVYRSNFRSEAENKREEEGVFKNANQKMQLLIEQIARVNADIKVSAHCVKGSLITLINDFVGEHTIDLVVTGTEGATGIKYVLLGSNAYDIAKKLSVPFIVVPSTTQNFTIKKVAFFTDYDPNDKDTLQSLVSTLNYADLKYHFVHILEDSNQPKEEDVQKMEDWTESLKNHANLREVSYELVYGKKNVDLIKDISKREDVHLLILTLKEVSFFDKFFNKTLAREIIMQGNTPLFLKRV